MAISVNPTVAGALFFFGTSAAAEPAVSQTYFFALWQEETDSAIILCVTFSLIVTVIYLIFADPILTNEASLATVLGQILTAALSIWYICHIFQIVISIAVGMAAGCIHVAGYNVGAGRNDRVKALFTRLLIGEFVTGAAALIFVEFFSRELIGVFGAANESKAYTDFAVKAFRTYLCLMNLATVNKGTFYTV